MPRVRSKCLCAPSSIPDQFAALSEQHTFPGHFVGQGRSIPLWATVAPDLAADR